LRQALAALPIFLSVFKTGIISLRQRIYLLEKQQAKKINWLNEPKLPAFDLNMIVYK
jgi:hypothetical protein